MSIFHKNVSDPGHDPEDGEDVFSQEETQAEVSDVDQDQEAFITITTNCITLQKSQIGEGIRYRYLDFRNIYYLYLCVKYFLERILWKRLQRRYRKISMM